MGCRKYGSPTALKSNNFTPPAGIESTRAGGIQGNTQEIPETLNQFKHSML
jgi:hypothetical protein